MGNANAAKPSKNSIKGALIGMVFGEAIGLANTGYYAGCFKPTIPNSDTCPIPLYGKSNSWGDSSAQTLCLADEYLRCNAYREVDELAAYRRWYHQRHWSNRGVSDVPSHMMAVVNYCGPLQVAYSVSDPVGVVRAIAASVCWSNGQDVAFLATSKIGGNRESCDCASAMARCIKLALCGFNKPFPDYVDRWDESLRVRNAVLKDAPKNPHGPWTPIDVLSTAIYAFRFGDSFRSVMEKSIQSGGRADLVAAAAGSLYGALNGPALIYLSDLCKSIESLDRLDHFAERLYARWATT